MKKTAHTSHSSHSETVKRGEEKRKGGQFKTARDWYFYRETCHSVLGQLDQALPTKSHPSKFASCIYI